MLTKEKRNKIIAGALVLSMLTGVAGCGSDEAEQQEENGQSNSTMMYPWWMFWHWPMFGGTTTNVRQTPAPGTQAGNEGNAQSKVTGTEAAKTGAATSKVQSPTTGKTGISSGSARSSAVS